MTIKPSVESAAVICENISLSLSGRLVLDKLNFALFSGEVLAILGASGSGKTSLLRVIAGLEKPDEGAVLISGENAIDLKPGERGISFAFQDYSLFPNKTVEQNLDFPLKVKKRSSEVRRGRVNSLLKFLGAVFVNRRRERPVKFSMGEKQRVSVGRALAESRPIVLLDEPLSEVDLRSKAAYIRRFRELAKQDSAAVVYVTNSREEAMAVADRVLILDSGSAVAIGAPMQLYSDPPSLSAASALGERPINSILVNYNDGQLYAGDRKVLDFTGDFPVSQFLLAVRPENLIFDPEGQLETTVEFVERLSPQKGFLHLGYPQGWVVEVADGNFPNKGDSLCYRFEDVFFFSRNGETRFRI